VGRRNFLVQNRAAGSGPQGVEQNQKEQVGDRQNSGTGSVVCFKQGIQGISERNLRISARGISRFPCEESPDFRVRNLPIFAWGISRFSREESPDFRVRNLEKCWSLDFQIGSWTWKHWTPVWSSRQVNCHLMAGITVAHRRADCLGMVRRQVSCHLWRAEMWHTAGLTTFDPSGQWQVNSQQVICYLWRAEMWHTAGLQLGN
jgi:hypothetical protein